MGATAVRRDVHDTVVNATPTGIEFFHGYTCSGHPLAAAAALATLAVYEEERLFARASALAPVWEAALHSLRGARHVIDVRTLGLMAGIELEPRPGNPGTRAHEAFVSAFRDHDVLIRVTGDTIALSPPLIISDVQIHELVEKVRRAIEQQP